jgi:DNA-binding response OmpR family regulator
VRTTPNTASRYQDVHLTPGFNCKIATLDTHHLMLIRKEYELFSLLGQNAGEIVPHEVLLSRV